MQDFVLLGMSAFLLCLVLTPVCRDLFLRYGLVDHPDDDRKFHLRAVPRMGGIPIAISYTLSLALLLLLHRGHEHIYIQHAALFLAILPAAALIFTTGLLDDIFALRPWQKLAGQFAGAVLAVSLGVRMSLPHLPPGLAIVLSVVWLVACTNAINLIDGMDGLASGVGLLASLASLVFAIRTGNVGLALAITPMAGCLLGFLRYNFSPASVFLGDCGSLTIGFVLGCFSLVWSRQEGTVLGILAPLMALALPLVDVALAIGRRFLRAVPIFKGDRGHIHHRVLSFGLSTRSAALLLYGVCCIFASLAILTSFHGRGFGWPSVCLFATLVLLGIARLRYVEFAATRNLLANLTVRRAVADQIFLEELRLRIEQAEHPDDWWQIVRETGTQLLFASATLDLDGMVFKEHFLPSRETPSCRIHLDLGERGSLVLTRLASTATPRSMMGILNHLQTAICEPATLQGKTPRRSTRHVSPISTRIA